MATPLDFKELQNLAAEILGIEPDQVQLDKSFAKDLAADSPPWRTSTTWSCSKRSSTK
jgi:hypothetical protein